jgi:hypothetical protein
MRVCVPPILRLGTPRDDSAAAPNRRPDETEMTMTEPTGADAPIDDVLTPATPGAQALPTEAEDEIQEKPQK